MSLMVFLVVSTAQLISTGFLIYKFLLWSWCYKEDAHILLRSAGLELTDRKNNKYMYKQSNLHMKNDKCWTTQVSEEPSQNHGQQPTLRQPQKPDVHP